VKNRRAARTADVLLVCAPQWPAVAGRQSTFLSTSQAYDGSRALGTTLSDMFPSSAVASVIGIGGIMTTEDALVFMIAGEKAVQIGTANFINPHATIEIIDGIRHYLRDNKIQIIKDIVGTLRT